MICHVICHVIIVNNTMMTCHVCASYLFLMAADVRLTEMRVQISTKEEPVLNWHFENVYHRDVSK